MKNLNTTFIGIPISSPIVVGSCGLSSTVDGIQKLAEQGAGAIVLKSVFEEEILMEYEKTVLPKVGPMGNDQEFFDYYDYQIKTEVLNKYVQLIKDAREKVNIPLIASINCRSSNEWMAYAVKLEEAGISGLELNLFRLPFHTQSNSEQLENEYISIIEKVKQKVRVPIAVKISPYITNLAEFTRRLSSTGINAIVMFNRFYNIDFDIKNEQVVSAGAYSQSAEYALPLRWTSILCNRLECEVVAATGIHTGETAIKMLLAGARSVQVVSTIYQNGPGQIRKMLHEIDHWMTEKGYESLDEFRGNLSQTMADNPEVFERVQFMKYFSDHKG
jgi:dihydroorotate dehydrogenase (fumarate)